MKFKNFVPKDQRPKLQLLVELTKPSSYKKSCLWPNCNSVPIEAHAVPVSWMRAIETNRKVIEFDPSSRNYLSRDVRWAATPRGQRPIQLQPKPRDTRDAQWYFFLCRDHDGSFNGVDKLTETQDYSLRNLNWAVYRSVLAQECRVGALKWASTESGFINSSLHSKLNDGLEGLRWYKRKLQQCLEPQNCTKCDGIHCSFVTHTILPLKGKPKLAACTFSLGLRDHENWGLTVVPLTGRTGHDVIWHHFGEHRKVMEECISRQQQAQGKRREELVSQCILRFADALVVSPEWWESIGDKRRDAIVEMVSAETGIAIGTREWVSSWVSRANTPILDLSNPRQLNLFRDT